MTKQNFVRTFCLQALIGTFVMTLQNYKMHKLRNMKTTENHKILLYTTVNWS